MPALFCFCPSGISTMKDRSVWCVPTLVAVSISSIASHDDIFIVSPQFNIHPVMRNLKKSSSRLQSPKSQVGRVTAFIWSPESFRWSAYGCASQACNVTSNQLSKSIGMAVPLQPSFYKSINDQLLVLQGCLFLPWSIMGWDPWAMAWKSAPSGLIMWSMICWKRLMVVVKCQGAEGCRLLLGSLKFMVYTCPRQNEQGH